jgi:hypothetical protein
VTEAGWYTDGNGDTRWWDGERWTEHVRQPPGDAGAAAEPPPVQPTGGEIRVTVRALEIVGDANRIAFRGKEFSLAAVDRVAYRSVASRVNGAYMGTSFLLKLGQGSTHDTLLLDGGRRDKRLDELRAAWTGLVDLVEAHVTPRIATDAVATIDGGGTVAFGSIVAGPEGVKAKRPLAKVIPWSDIAGTEISNIGLLQVSVRRDDGSTKARLSAGLDQWNTVVLPRVVAHFARA